MDDVMGAAIIWLRGQIELMPASDADRCMKIYWVTGKPVARVGVCLLRKGVPPHDCAVENARYVFGFNRRENLAARVKLERLRKEFEYHVDNCVIVGGPCVWTGYARRLQDEVRRRGKPWPD